MVTLATQSNLNVIKPMLFDSPDTHSEFLEMLVSYYSKGQKVKELPLGLEYSVKFLKSRGITTISLLGLCWGGCIVQQVISTGKIFIISSHIFFLPVLFRFYL